MRLAVIVVVGLAALGCKKAPSEKQQYAADVGDLCNAFARSGAAPGDFTTAVGWSAKQTRTKRFREQMSHMAEMAPGDKVALLAAAMKEAGVVDCPFLDGWKQGAATPPVVAP
jgi:hypothetical protein